MQINYSGERRLLAQIKTLLETTVGTVPYDRDFGIDISILDKPLPIAKNLYLVEVVEKIETYIPNVTIESIEFSEDGGKLIPKVVTIIDG